MKPKFELYVSINFVYLTKRLLKSDQAIPKTSAPRVPCWEDVIYGIGAN